MKDIKRFKLREFIVEYCGISKLYALMECDYCFKMLKTNDVSYSWQSSPHERKRKYFRITRVDNYDRPLF